MVATKKRILIVVPVFQSVYPKPFMNFSLMFMKTAGDEGARYEFYMHVPERTILHDAMNKAAQIVLDPHNSFDAMIMLDDDCFPPFNAISTLLRHMETGHQIVGGLGFMRGFPHTTTVGRYYPEGMTIDLSKTPPEASGFYWVEDTTHEPALMPADFCGFPICLVTRAALLKMEPPWFGTHLDGGGCTHDVYFGAKAAKAKVPIVVDKTIECGHLAEAPIITVHNRMKVREAWSELQRQLKS